MLPLRRRYAGLGALAYLILARAMMRTQDCYGCRYTYQ